QRAYTPPDSGIDRFEELQERLGLTRAVFVQASCHGTDNSALLHAVRRGNGKYSGVAMIDDDTTDLEIRQLHEAGVRGIRFNFVAHLGGAPDLDTYWRLIKRIAPLGWHVALHFDAKDLPNYAQMLDQMPVPYLIDHMARIRVEDGLEQEPFQTLLAMLKDERAWVKLSGVERITASGSPPYNDVVPYIQALIATAPDRVLWGTDWPHPNVQHMPDDGDLVDLLAAFAADDSVYSRILVENPERLYPFS
ncbi:MAG: amidohydrolase family protein, partial [Actinomycetota bacterium]|nr:amidohydrolase family protein [Actinomycetota bacterium]